MQEFNILVTFHGKKEVEEFNYHWLWLLLSKIFKYTILLPIQF